MEPSVLSRSRMTGKKTVNSRRIMAAVMVIVMLAALTGCVGKEDTQTRKKNKVVEIPMILTVDSSTGNKNEEEVVERFNRAYKGKYHIDVDWVMETEEEYRKNLKRMNVTDELPAIITDLRMLPSFYQMMIKKGRIEDLTPYINEDQEWKDMIEPSVMESVREEDGKIYLGPVSTAAFACSGVFWNRELFEQAGISRFPETWEEFWKCCEKLKAAGITPLALHTEGTAWAAMLLATAEVAGSEEGAAFMKQLYPDTYQNEPGLEIAGTLKKLFQYTTQDALHNDFDVAYDNFVAGNAAMIPNGYWMIDKIPEEMQKKVCFSTFPENKLIGSPETFGWAVVSTYSEKVKKGAVEFLKFRTKLNKEQKEELLNSRTRQEGTLLDDYLKAYTGNPQIVPNYQVKWNSLLQENVLGECLAELVQGKITEQEFTQAEDEILPIYIGVEGEEDQGICTGTENYWCVNSKASEDDIQATLDFMNWCVTSDDGVKAMCKDMGFTIPFKKNLKSDNVLVNEANKYTEDGKTPVSWNFSTMPSEEWKNGVGSALTSYAADQTDANWAKVTTAFVDGWAKEAAAAK